MKTVKTLLLAALCGTLCAQNSLVESGFNHFYNLEYDEAIADFAALYAAINGTGRSAASEVTLIIKPWPCCCIASSAR